MLNPRIRLKDRYVAALLAWLIPGSGHLYQGRFFKAAIFSVCILATFTYGLALGDWQGVYFQDNVPAAGRKRAWGFLAQVGVGLPSIPALVQHKRYYSEQNQKPAVLEEAISEPFIGLMEDVTPEGGFRRVKLSGHITLKPVQGEFGPEGEGEFQGTTQVEGEDPKPATLKIAGAVRLGPPVAPERGRSISCVARSDENGGGQNGRQIEGEIPRAFLNRVSVPLDDDGLQRIHGRLGKLYELSLVYTWIAGLLNILAIWDAFEGPAYGYGDEPPEEEGADGKKDASKEGTATASTPAAESKPPDAKPSPATTA